MRKEKKRVTIKENYFAIKIGGLFDRPYFMLGPDQGTPLLFCLKADANTKLAGIAARSYSTVVEVEVREKKSK